MKQTISLFLCLLLLVSLAACGETVEEETTEATTAYEYKGPSLEEMSPPSMSTALPIELPLTYGAVDKSEFKLIKAENSLWPETEATSVYQSGNFEYYIMSEGVYVLITGEEDDALLSAFYDKEGRLMFLNDDAKNWYFTEEGEFDYMTYTYESVTGAQVITFYEGEDSRFAVYAGQTYYDGDLQELTEKQKIELVTRVAAAFSMMGGMNNL